MFHRITSVWVLSIGKKKKLYNHLIDTKPQMSHRITSVWVLSIGKKELYNHLIDTKPLMSNRIDSTYLILFKYVFETI